MPLARRALLLFALAPASRAQHHRLAPVDQSHTDPSFAAFRTQLLQIIARRDSRALLAVATPDIKLSFGGDEGTEDMRRFWNLDQPRQSRIWNVLETLLRLGCVRDPNGDFTAPYSFALWPNAFDAYEHAVAVHPAAPLHERPERTSAVLKTLDYEIVKVLEMPDSAQNPPQNQWWRVQVPPNGPSGYALASHIRSPLDYRARFEKQQGKWRMTLLVSGD